MRRLTWRIPNVALSAYVPVAAEARIAPSGRSMLITLPPGVTLSTAEENIVTGPDGSRWRLEQASALEAIAHEV